MRKLIRAWALAMLALAATAVAAHAQGKTFGIIAGADFATFTGSDASGFTLSDPSGSVVFGDKKSVTGFTGGVFVNIPAGGVLSFEPEILYAGKGAKYTVDLYDDIGGFIGSGELTAHLDYIMIPVLLKYNFQPSGGPYGLIGPEVGFNVSCSLEGAGGSVDCSSDLGLETSTTFGGIVGLGYQKGPFGVEGRYDFDFGDAFSNLSGLKNAAWEVLLRYQFR